MDDKKKIGMKLAFFTLFQSSSESQRLAIAETSRVLPYPANKAIIKKGALDKKNYIFLLEGEISLSDELGWRLRIIAGNARSKEPILALKPSPYVITTHTPIVLIAIDAGVMQQNRIENPAAGYAIKESRSDCEEEEDSLLYELLVRLKNDDFKLPSLPDIATKIRETLANNHSCAQDIAQVVLCDPAMTAKLIKTANSPLFRRGGPVDNCQTAVVRLGAKTTTELVTAYALKELYQCDNKLLNKRMRQLWQHSVDIASISCVLAKHVGFDPDHALLAGLIHDVGVVAILTLAAEYPALASSSSHLNKIVKDMRAEVGGTILSQWGFLADLVDAARHAQNWLRDAGPADYSDIVNVAHIYSYIGTSQQNHAPTLEEIPGYHKLSFGQKLSLVDEGVLSSLEVYADMQEEIKQAKQLLHI